MATIEDVVFKVITDKTFARQLLANPEVVLRAEGIAPTPEVLDVLKDLDEDELAKMAEQFNAGNIAM
jgi:hypothetical protein